MTHARIDIRGMHRGEITDEARQLWARLEGEKASFPQLPKTTRLTECVCTRLYGSEPCVPDMMALPAHSTCGTIVDADGKSIGGMCWCWTGCDDEDCDHPACGDKGWRDFSAAYPDEKGKRDVLVWTSPWEQWETSGRHPQLLDEWRAGQHRCAKEPKPDRLLRALETGKPVDSLRVGGSDYLAIELALVDGGMQLECRWVAESTEAHVAYTVARGGSVDSMGGSIHGQIRLAQALDLATAPVGFQGALF